MFNSSRPRAFDLKAGILAWLPLAVVATAAAATVYVAVQQGYRNSANDPQIQMAEDLASLLATQAKPADVIPAGDVDMAKSLAPLVTVYDDRGVPIVSMTVLDGRIPAPPAGVFDAARASGEDRITWQPRQDVRRAAVVVRYGGASPGFVLVSRSLREVEVRESALGAIVVEGWFVMMLGSFLAFAGASFRRKA